MKSSTRVLFTRKTDGGVSIFNPSLRTVSVLQQGNGYGRMLKRGTLEVQTQRLIEDGIDQDIAQTFVNAYAFGGNTEAEALKILIDRSCAHEGLHIDVVTKQELPPRFYRNAWIRSPNGGPVNISLDKAKIIQWDTLYSSIEAENKKREREFELRPLIEVPWETIRSSIRHARDVDELSKIWIAH
jgi:hypothetical protein